MEERYQLKDAPDWFSMYLARHIHMEPRSLAHRLILSHQDQNSFHIPLRYYRPSGENSTAHNSGNVSRNTEHGADHDIAVTSHKMIEAVLGDMPLKPVFWRYSSKRINYRRFFAVNGLISIRSEDIGILEKTHHKFFQLASNKCVSGIRIDHLDGLHSPEKYVELLRKALPEKIYIAEKVLMPGEQLKKTLHIHGTTGYDFLGILNSLYVEPRGFARLRESFVHRLPNYSNVNEILRLYKEQFLKEEFSGDVDNLSWPLYESMVLNHGYEFSYSEIRESVEKLLASFEVYRTYATIDDASDLSDHLRTVTKKSSGSIEHILAEHLDRRCQECTEPLLKIQQYSGALMAKNLEDRLFYTYCPLIFLNEVGWSPAAELPLMDDLLEFIQKRRSFPYSFNEGSTHDTKFGEDLRAAGLVISQYADLFLEFINDLHLEPGTASDLPRIYPEHVYYVTQLILASYGFREFYKDYRKEISSQIIKALRESMINTSWISPDEKYENLVTEFAGKIMDIIDSGSLDAATTLVNKCRDIGHYISASMLVLRFLLPGTPSLYQGSESINVHFTDPDNREKVDFKFQQKRLDNLQGMRLSIFNPSDFPEIELDMVINLARIRRECYEIIQNGTLRILNVTGKNRDSVIAYCIQAQKEILTVITFRFFSGIVDHNNRLDQSRFNDDRISFSQDLQGTYEDMLTGSKLDIKNEISIRELTGNLPAIILRRLS